MAFPYGARMALTPPPESKPELTGLRVGGQAPMESNDGSSASRPRFWAFPVVRGAQVRQSVANSLA
jgi:hypothetical protein